MKMNETDPLDLEIAASSFAALGSEQRLTVLRVLVRAGARGSKHWRFGQAQWCYRLNPDAPYENFV